MKTVLAAYGATCGQIRAISPDVTPAASRALSMGGRTVRIISQNTATNEWHHKQPCPCPKLPTRYLRFLRQTFCS